MKSFKQFLTENFLKEYNDDFFWRVIKEEFEEKGENHFETCYHVDNEQVAADVHECETSLFSPLDESESLEESRANAKSILVNHGAFVRHDSNKKTLLDGSPIPEDGENIKKVDIYKRLELLKSGWMDWEPMSKKDENGNIIRYGIDPRDAEKYKSEGFVPGWGEKTILFKDLGNGKTDKPSVFQDEIETMMKKGYKVFEPVMISKTRDTKQKVSYRDAESGKYGDKQTGKKTDIMKVDVTQLQDYIDQGFSQGVNMYDGYMRSFSIASTNGKLGKVGNFSLTPGPQGSCPSDVPCGGICYARVQYNQYPDCKAAWDKNFKLLKEHPDWFVDDINRFFKTHSKMKLFRWHVAGDLQDRKHLDMINQIAVENEDVTFWIYTKNLDAIRGFTPSKNLIVIISAWNDWKLDQIDGNDKTHRGKDGLHKDFPVAYFDDWNHKDLIPTDDNSYQCPCADYSIRDDEMDYMCQTCKTHGNKGGDSHPCYTLKAGESMIFRKH